MSSDSIPDRVGGTINDGELGADDFRHLAEALPNMIWTSDPSGEIDYLSPQFYQFTGVSPQGPEAFNWLVCIHPDDQDEIEEIWRNAVATGKRYDHQFRMRSASGDFFWFAAKAVPVIGEGGEVLKWYGTTNEIDQQKRGELALLEAAKQKDRFIAMLGHELRNPLAAIATSYDSLKTNQLSETRRKTAFSLLGRQITHLKRLVDDTLDIARLESGRLDLEVEKLDVNLLAKDCMEDYQGSAEELGLAISVEIADEPIWVEGDEVRLSQCLSNLVSNAIKFTNKGGKVTIYARKSADGQNAELEVLDSGIGMEEDEIGLLFTPFEQGESAKLLSKDGLGLGLAVVKKLVEMHKGKVSVSSPGRERGTSFVISIPGVEGPDGEAGDSPVVEEVQTPVGQARVLVIEDNPSVARALEIFLELDGHLVSLAEEGTAGLEAVKRETPDVVFCDLSLPGDLKGWDVAQEICGRLDKDSRPYLVALSGHAQQEYVDRSLKAGFDRHVAKPPEPEVLRECVRQGVLRR